jgi:hypothetical protein
VIVATARDGRAGCVKVVPMPSRIYRLEVQGELSETVGCAFEGMSLMHEQGNTVLEGLVEDQAELTGLLQQVSEFGLTLLSVNAIDSRSSG